jgi:hypothetical protein
MMTFIIRFDATLTTSMPSSTNTFLVFYVLRLSYTQKMSLLELVSGLGISSSSAV